MPSEYPGDYGEFDSDDRWYSSEGASVRRSETIRSVSSNTSASSVFSRSIAQVLPWISSSPSKYLLPHWCLYVTYFLCFLLSAFSIVVIILYGHAFGTAMAIKWLLACCISIVESIIIIEPLKVLLLAMLLAFVARGIDDQDLDVIETEPMFEVNEKLQDTRLKPLAGYALTNARREGEKLREMRRVIREVISHMFLFWTVVTIAYVTHSDWAYLSASSKVDLFVSTNITSDAGCFRDIRTTSDWWIWTETVLAPQLFRAVDKDSNDQDYLLGVARLRQIRFRNEKCQIADYMKECGADYLVLGGCFAVKDTGDYVEGWNVDQGRNATWIYQTTSALQGGRYTGIVDSYSGDGFAHLLGTSVTDTLSILNDLKTNQWLDRGTRFAITEFNMYNPAQNFIIVVRLVAELPTAGGIVTSFDVRSYRPLTSMPGHVDVVMVFEALLALITLYFVIHLVYTIVMDGPLSILTFWTLVDVVLACLCVAQIVLYIQRIVTDTSLQEQYMANGSEDFTSFMKGLGLAYDWYNITAILVFIMTIWFARQLRFFKWMSRYSKTLRKAKWQLVGCSFIFTHITVGYAGLGYLWFGSIIATYHTLGRSILTQIGLSTGEMFLIDEMQMHSRVFTEIFVCVYMVIVLIIVTGLFVAVLTRSLQAVKQEMFYNNSVHMHDHELVDFVIKRFKRWAGITKPKPAFRRVKFHGMASLSTHSSWSSGMWQSESFISNASSDMSSLQEEEAQPYLHELINRAAPTWEHMCDKLDQVFKMDEEESELLQRMQSMLQQGTNEPEEENPNWLMGKTSRPGSERLCAAPRIDISAERRRRSQSDPYAAGTGDNVATPHSEGSVNSRTSSKFLFMSAKNRVRPTDMERPKNEVPPYWSSNRLQVRRPTSDQSPRRTRGAKEDPDCGTTAPDSKPAW